MHSEKYMNKKYLSSFFMVLPKFQVLCMQHLGISLYIENAYCGKEMDLFPFHRHRVPAKPYCIRFFSVQRWRIQQLIPKYLEAYEILKIKDYSQINNRVLLNFEWYLHK